MKSRSRKCGGDTRKRMHPKTIYSLPRELLASIIYRIPVDSTLRSISQCSKQLFYSFLSDVKFATAHIHHHLQLNDNLNSKLHDRENIARHSGYRIARIHWSALPLVYKTAILGHVFRRLGSKHFREFLTEFECVDGFRMDSQSALIVVDRLWEQRALQKSRAMVWACRFGHLDAVKFLIDVVNLDPSIQDDKPLRIACEHGHENIVRLLAQDKRTRPNANDNDAIVCAARGGHLSTVDFLLKIPAVNPAARDNAPMWEASRNGFADVLKLLLTDARVDAADRDGDALVQAAKYGHVGVVEVLLKGDCVDPSSQEGKALYWAQARGWADIVALLQQKDVRDHAYSFYTSMVLTQLLSPTILQHLPSAAQAVASKLNEIGCCRVCIVRLLGVRKQRLFVALCSPVPTDATGIADTVSTAPPSVTAATATPDAAPVSSITSSACPACLNLLSHASVSAAVARAHALFSQKPSRGLSSFLVSVRVPVQLALRAHAIGRIVEKVIGPDVTPFANVALRDPKRFDLNDPPKSESASAATAILNDPLDNQPFSIHGHQIEVKEVLKHLLIHHLEQTLNLPFESSSALQLEIGFDHPETDTEYDFMGAIKKCGLNVRKKRKRVREGSLWRKMRDDEHGHIRIEGATWNHIVHAAENLSYEDYEEHGYLPLKAFPSLCAIGELKFLHFSLWLAGRYNKYNRTISNSRMEFKGERLAQESVEELLALHVDKFFGADGHKFSSAGREDVDVLMLGSGRPFYLEIVNPRVLDATPLELKQLQDLVNSENDGKIKVSDLQLVGKHDTKPLKDSAATKRKSYSTLVRLSSGVTMDQLNAISKLKDLELKQQTPIRVQNSRSDMVREKIIHELNVVPEDEGVFEDQERKFSLVRVNLTTSAGTYVKEFMHSDGGRTVPSLKELLAVDSASVETLDVLHVFLDWPPPVI
ncbi:putative tRNA pseudouridine synthase Pus10 [Chytriomyces hyalinus]|nr:putative tRNA pseudouridine synthase Pus10 [Chytriomyces hyalinus]